MTDTAPITPERPSGKKLLVGSAVAAILAVVAVVVFVLPAEYGIDPTGLGKTLGLTKLSESATENIYLKRGQARTNVLFPIDRTAEQGSFAVRDMFAEKGVTWPANAQMESDRFQFELQPFEGIELKYVLAEGAPMFFSWRTTAPVNVDMHSHPFEGGTEATESFVIDDLQNQSAVYVAPFTGIHGWYWQNRTMQPVQLTLDASGAFTGSKIFDAAGEHDRALERPNNQADPQSGDE